MLEKITAAPTWFYITAIAITIAIASISVINIVYRYKKWVKVSYIEDKQIASILNTLRAMHEQTLRITRTIDIKQFMNNSKLWGKAQDEMLDIWNISTNDIVTQIKNKKISPITIIGYIQKTLKFDIRKKKSMRQIIEMGAVFEKYGQGVNQTRDTDFRYNELKKELNGLRDNLAVSNEGVAQVIDNTQLYSYCVSSLLLYTTILNIKLKHVKIKGIDKYGFSKAWLNKMLTKMITQAAMFDGIADMMINKQLEKVRLMIKEAAIK